MDLLLLFVVSVCGLLGGLGALVILLSGPLRTYAYAYANDQTLLAVAMPSGRLHLLRVTEDRAGYLKTGGGLEFEITQGSGYNLGGVPLFFADLTLGMTQRLDVAQYTQAAAASGIMSISDALARVNPDASGVPRHAEGADVVVDLKHTVSFKHVANWIWDIGPGTIQNRIELEVAEVLRQNRNVWNSGFAMFMFVLLVGVGVFYIMVNNTDQAVLNQGIEIGIARCEAQYGGVTPRGATSSTDRPPLVTVKPTR